MARGGQEFELRADEVFDASSSRVWRGNLSLAEQENLLREYVESEELSEEKVEGMKVPSQRLRMRETSRATQIPTFKDYSQDEIDRFYEKKGIGDY